MKCIARRGREKIIHFGNEIFGKVRKILNHQRSYLQHLQYMQ